MKVEFKAYPKCQCLELIVGCDAGTLNMPKIKGSHTAMKSGMIAAETIFENLKENKELSIYEDKFKKSWVYEELHQAEMLNLVLVGV